MNTTTTQCPGSFDSLNVTDVRHGKSRVTGKCAECGRRIAFVGVETFIDNKYVGKFDRVLGAHDKPVSK
jgi:hypothetical protein